MDEILLGRVGKVERGMNQSVLGLDLQSSGALNKTVIKDRRSESMLHFNHDFKIRQLKET